MIERTERTNLAGALGWGFFLACSWTWCIGMFLPVLLVRDYGVWGWVVFAVPNVVGAAAMGWVFRTAEASRALVARHSAACVAFSFVTVTFQWYFAAWLLRELVLPIVGVALLLVFLTRAPRFDRIIALIVFVASLVAFGVLLASGSAFAELPEAVRPLQRSSTELFPLALVCVFGFLLCPYLDLTFHRARQSTSDLGARIAFGVGFGVFFLVMILMTLAYAGPLAGVPRGEWARPVLTTAATIAVTLHMIVQLAFTIAVHLREAATVPQEHVGRARRSELLLVGPIAALVGVALGWYAPSAAGYRDVSMGEVVYLLFMAFYGLVFPAYVWVCVIPRKGGGGAPARRCWGVFAVAVLIAAPLYWMGFIERRMVWLVPGVAVVAIARLALGRRPANGPSPLPSPPSTGERE